jgi:hypothetical protein
LKVLFVNGDESGVEKLVHSGGGKHCSPFGSNLEHDGRKKPIGTHSKFRGLTNTVRTRIFGFAVGSRRPANETWFHVPYLYVYQRTIVRENHPILSIHKESLWK